MSPSNHSEDTTDQPVRPLIDLAAAGLLATAGGLHLAALPGHLQASTVAGAFFAVTAAAQLVGAVLLATRPSWRTVAAIVAGNVAVLILWAMSRTTGLPTGGELGIPEPFGLLDGFAAAAEILVVVTGVATMAGRSRPTCGRSGGRRLALTLALAWGISGGAGLALADDGHHHGGAHRHSEPASARHSQETPTSSRSITGASCPVGHDCNDHSH